MFSLEDRLEIAFDRNDCQDEPALSQDHAVAMEMFALTSAINALMRRAATPEGRDLLVRDVVELGRYTVRLQLITSAVEARDTARI